MRDLSRVEFVALLVMSTVAAFTVGWLTAGKLIG